jgi:hypothetical protein
MLLELVRVALSYLVPSRRLTGLSLELSLTLYLPLATAAS